MTRIIKLSLLGILVIALVAGVFLAVQAEATDQSLVHLSRVIDMSPQGSIYATTLAVDSDLNVYIIDGTAENPRVLKYDKQGRFVLEWGGRGSGHGKFEFWPANPEDGPNAGFIAVDRRGNVYVSDAYNFRIQKFDPQGNFLMQFGEMGIEPGQIDPPCAGPIYIDRSGNIWVSTFSRVQEFDAQGRFLASYGSGGIGNGEFMGAALGAVDSEGNMYIGDYLNARVQKLDANGNFLMAWGTPGTGEGQFVTPVGIVLDEQNKLYITDNTNRVQVFTTSGQYLGQWSEPGKGYPVWDLATSGIAIDRKGDIYVPATYTEIFVFRTRK